MHDGPLFYDDKHNYYEFAYHELYERYSYMASDITFVMRTKQISGTTKFTRVPDQIHVISVPNFKSLRTYIPNKRTAKKIVEEQVRSADIIVLRSQSSIAQIAIGFAKKYNKPYIIECVGCSWDSYWNHGLIGKLVAPYMFYKTKSAIKNADYVYYVTEEFLQRRYPTKGKSVSCSNVVIEKTDPKVLEKRTEKIRRFNPAARMVVGTAAALDTRYKGHEYVIRALPRLVKKGYNIEYHLAGGYTSQNNNTFLKDLAESLGVSERVVFCGSLSSSQMNDYYDSLDLYIQPSKQEGLPRSIIEAMSRGCPVIGTSIAGIPELIPRECLFKKGSVNAVIQAVEDTIRLDLSEMADRNYYRAQKYEKSLLIKKRQDFYDCFIMDNQKKGTLP